MTRGKLSTTLAVLLAAMAGEAWVQTEAQGSQVPQATFRSSIDLVRVSAVVRDRRGRFVRDLSARDLEVLEGGQVRPITDFAADSAGTSVALLFDVSGSMEGGLVHGREAAKQLLARLESWRDEAAVFAFDTGLVEVVGFTNELERLVEHFGAVSPFGATSLYDAVARTAERLEARARRSAVVVFTDGNDNASRMNPSEVAAAASAIDVPVYVFGIVSALDNPTASIAVSPGRSSFAGGLADLARQTGGQVFIASTPLDRAAAARQIADELRHQYLIAFESSGRPGWRPLVVRARSKDLIVRARSGYIAGQSRPISQ
jgi:Ca-activated chloride channel homolog